MLRQYELIQKAIENRKDGKVDEAFLDRAYVFAMKMRGTQARASGDPYYKIGLGIANELIDFAQSDFTLASALLFNVTKDTPATFDDVEKIFGQKFREYFQLYEDFHDLIVLLGNKGIESNAAVDICLNMASEPSHIAIYIAGQIYALKSLDLFQDKNKTEYLLKWTKDFTMKLSDKCGLDDFSETIKTLLLKNGAISENNEDRQQASKNKSINRPYIFFEERKKIKENMYYFDKED